MWWVLYGVVTTIFFLKFADQANEVTAWVWAISATITLQLTVGFLIGAI